MRTLLEQSVAMDDSDALGEGREDFHRLNYDLTLGFDFGIPEGGFLLERSCLYPTARTPRYVGVATSDDGTISNDVFAPHEGDAFADLFLDPELDDMLDFPFAQRRSCSAYLYSAARVLGNGFTSRMCPPIRTDFDADRRLITPLLPAPPSAVTAVPISGGRFLVSWSYDPYGQGAWPVDFQVFHGTVGVDWGVPLQEQVSGLLFVPFHPLRRRHEFVTAAFANGTSHVFGVRGRNASGICEANIIMTAARLASSSGPTAAKVVTAVARR